MLQRSKRLKKRGNIRVREGKDEHHSVLCLSDASQVWQLKPAPGLWHRLDSSVEKMNARIHAGVPQLFLTCVCIWSLLVNLFTMTLKKKDMQEQMSEKVPHCLLQKRKRSEPKDYPVRDSIQHSDSMDTICCHPCLRQQTNRRCKFSNCVLFVCVDPISHDFKEGLGLLDLLVHLGSSCHYYICIIPAGHRSACAPTDTP